MKLSELLNQYYDRTSKASDVSRQLAFAGLALVWIFKTEISGGYVLPVGVQLPLILLIIALGADLAQYSVTSCILHILHRCEEKKANEKEKDPEIGGVPRWVQYPATILFIIKIVCVVIAYILLFLFAKSSVAFGG